PSPSGLHIGPPEPLLLMPLLLMPLLPLALLPLVLPFPLPLALLPLTPPAPVPLDALAPPVPLLAPTDPDENRLLSPVPPQLEPAITVKPETKNPAMLHRNAIRDVLCVVHATVRCGPRGAGRAAGRRTMRDERARIGCRSSRR